MAKKQTMNRTAIMGQLKATGAMAQDDLLKDEAKAESDMQAYLKRANKEKTTLSIDLLDEAPPEWNFFPKLEPTKFLQLKMSIMNNGILTPIIVWEQENGRYMILAGHNRVRANLEILAEYADVENLSRDYQHVPVIIYGKDEIDEYKAKEIIIDTNYIQRGQFEPELRVLIVKNRMDLMKTQTDERGRRIDQIEQDLGIKKSAIYEDLQIGEKIIPELRQLYYDRKINRKAVLKFVHFMEPEQKKLYENYGSVMTSSNVSKLKKSMRMDDEFEEVFNPKVVVPMKTVKLEIPEEHYEEFMQLYSEFAASKWETKKEK